MSARGFSLAELLIAATIASLLVGALAAALVPARAAFESTPAAIDLHQRARIGAELLAGSLRSAGLREPAHTTLPSAGAVVPATIPLRPFGGGDAFAELEVFLPAAAGAHGVLDRDQPSAAAALTLQAGPGCPQTADVCGFVVGANGAISDGQGRFDIFQISSADSVRMTISPSRSLSGAYSAGAHVFEVETLRYALASQPDGSRVLGRTTGGGAFQPMVDGVGDLSIGLWGEAAAPRLTWDGTTGWASYGPEPPLVSFRDGRGEWPDGESCAFWRDGAEPRSRLADLGAEGTLVPLGRSLLSDGPWCAAGDRGYYDADLLRLRRIDLSMRVEALGAVRRVPDRLVSMSIALRRRP